MIDFLERLEQKSAQLVVEDDLDVFARYYAERPDEEVFEVFDE